MLKAILTPHINAFLNLFADQSAFQESKQ